MAKGKNRTKAKMTAAEIASAGGDPASAGTASAAAAAADDLSLETAEAGQTQGQAATPPPYDTLPDPSGKLPAAEAATWAQQAGGGVESKPEPAPDFANFARPAEKKPQGGGHGHGAMEEQQASPFWLAACFSMLMGSGVLFGMMMEYATSGGRKLHELSYILVTSAIYSLTARICRDYSGEAPTNVPESSLLALAIMSMASTFTSVRALRYVIFPVQVLAKSCKPVPVMLMGAARGKTYPMQKYVNVAIVVTGVALFMGGGSKESTAEADLDKTGPMMWFGVFLLFISLSFDGATGAYEDELMQMGHLGPFELMYNIQFGKMVIAFSCLLFNNEVNYFFQMLWDTGPVLFLLGLSGSMLQISIFVTISKCGALTCALFGVARKITTLMVSILFFGHQLNLVQSAGLAISIWAMVKNFMTKKSKKKEALPEATVNDGPKASLDLRDQTGAAVAEKKPLLNEEAFFDEEDEEEAFPTVHPNAKAAARA
eukprot:CAMPEP_0172605538 /NCGR_PEP_ID=MMETSP1068-20121228/25784_1 /TAXON_ID=35684 /ORGANISM="Pseudopedinella elastica, Strain CCMP716" /LENGTH=486 /DNA_ID=CAMNT_0013407977 /DNA_START=86 /DNA_END=1546 /DNA_ORIENTATION=+